MPRTYLAFDIETAREVPGEGFDWKPHRPLGICCAAALRQDSDEPIIWHGRDAGGNTAARMSQAETAHMVSELVRFASQGCTLLTWNGLAFDLDILAEESGRAAECKALATAQVDMMFHVVCAKGFPVGLDRAARGLGLPGKPAGMTGRQAPILWAQGQFREVIDYVTQDVRTALQVALASERAGQFRWLTAKGTVSSMPLGRGWLTVADALKLPLPDTSWMRDPLPRSRFTDWLGRT